MNNNPYAIDAIKAREFRNKSVDLALESARSNEEQGIQVRQEDTRGHKVVRWFGKKYKRLFGAWNNPPDSPKIIDEKEPLGMDLSDTDCSRVSLRNETKMELSIEELDEGFSLDDVSDSQMLPFREVAQEKNSYIMRFPLTITDAQLMQDKLNRQIAQMEQELKCLISNEAVFSQGMQNPILEKQRQIEHYEMHLGMVMEYLSQDPCSSSAVLGALSIIQNSALMFLDVQRRLNFNKTTQDVLDRQMDNEITWSRLEIDNLLYTIQIKINEIGIDSISAFKQGVISILRSKSNFKDLDIKRELKNAQVFVLNTQEWSVVDKKIPLIFQNGMSVAKSVIIPAKHLGNVFSDTYVNFGGISSHSITENGHCVNLCKTQLYNEENIILFQGYRHGVLSAYGIEDPVVRQAASRNRALELIQAIIVGDESLLDNFIMYSLQGNPLPLEVLSINLQTADNIRGAFSTLARDDLYNERKHIQEQAMALDELSNSIACIGVKDLYNQIRQVYVRPSIHTVNFGVNSMAVEGLGRMSSSNPILGCWTDSAIFNTKTMHYLFGNAFQDEKSPIGGKVAIFLNNPMMDQFNKSIVQQLALQILDIYKNERYKTAGQEPYKMVTRLAFMAYIMGMQVAFNCKSGKDRTGFMDAELKFLILMTYWHGEVPRPDKKLNPIEQQMLRMIVLGGGGLEIQRMNTGIAGFKADNSVTLERIGGEYVLPYLRGASAFVAN